jgi:UDP-N-acetylmuramyl pentapeptide synthase
MSATFSADEILYSTHGRIAAGGINDQKGRLVWDLEDIRDGDWFVALAAGYDDSHDHLQMAFELGAQGCVVNNRTRYSFAPSDGTLISVADTSVALMQLVSYWRHIVRPIAVGVVGSNGRRSIVKLLHQLLKDSFRCHIALESDRFGCARDVLSMPEDAQVLLFEAGAVERGDVARIGSALCPDVAVIGRVEHPIPSAERDARIAELYCEILETVDRSKAGIAIVYDANPAIAERSKLLLTGLASTSYVQRSNSLQEFSESELDSFIKFAEIATGQPVKTAEVWCALEAARAIGLSSQQISSAIGRTVAAYR